MKSIVLSLPFLAAFGHPQDRFQVKDDTKGFLLLNPKPKDEAWVVEKDADGFYSGEKSAILKHRVDGVALYVFVVVKEKDKTFGKDLQEIAENHLKNFEKDADNKPRKVKKMKSQELRPTPIKGQRVWYFDIEVSSDNQKFRAREWLFVDNKNQDHLVHLTCSLDDDKFKEHGAVIQAALGAFQTFKVKSR